MSWEWFNTGAGAASIVGLLVTLGGLWSAWQTNRLIASTHKDTLAVLERMETNAEARYRDLKDRLGGEADETP
jgi:hypothetical protein